MRQEYLDNMTLEEAIVMMAIGYELTIENGKVTVIEKKTLN